MVDPVGVIESAKNESWDVWIDFLKIGAGVEVFKVLQVQDNNRSKT